MFEAVMSSEEYHAIARMNSRWNALRRIRNQSDRRIADRDTMIQELEVAFAQAYDDVANIENRTVMSEAFVNSLADAREEIEVGSI